MKFRWSFTVLTLVLVTACKIDMGQDQEQEQGKSGDGGIPTTSFVDSIRINLPSKVCVGTNYQLTATVYPLSSDQTGTWSGGNSNGSITSGGVLSPSKVSSIPVSFRQTKTGKTASRDVNAVDCSTAPVGTGVEMTPVGTQTIVLGQSEVYFVHVNPMSFDQRIEIKLTGSCVSSQQLGPAAGTGYMQVRFTGTTVGKCTATAVSVANPQLVSNPVEFTVISNTGTVGNAYITIDEVTSWTTTVGGTRQFKATCHNFPAGTLCQPYFYTVGSAIVSVIGENKSLTNDPIFGTGTFTAGFAKAISKGSTQLYVQASKFNNQIYNFVPVTVN
jgi:hypothetical protein